MNTRHLSDFVREVRSRRGLSLKAVELSARALGEDVTASYVSLVENGRIPNPGHNKLIAIAVGLGIPEEEILAAARGRTLTEPEAAEIQLLTYYGNLPADRQKDLLMIARALHREHGVRPAQAIQAAKHKSRKAA